MTVALAVDRCCCVQRPETEESGINVSLSSAVEFSRMMEARMEEKRESKAASAAVKAEAEAEQQRQADVAMESAGPSDAPAPAAVAPTGSAAPAAASSSKAGEDNDDDGGGDDDEGMGGSDAEGSDDDDGDMSGYQGDSFTASDMGVGQGLAATLALLRRQVRLSSGSGAYCRCVFWRSVLLYCITRRVTCLFHRVPAVCQMFFVVAPSLTPTHARFHPHTVRLPLYVWLRRVICNKRKSTLAAPETSSRSGTQAPPV